MTHVVYSTLSADTAYTSYVTKDSIHVVDKQVTIQGGAKVANKHLVTSKGFATHVSDADLAHLEANPTFQLHKKNGFIHIEKKEVKIEKAIENMEQTDKSAPITPESLAAKKLARPARGKID